MFRVSPESFGIATVIIKFSFLGFAIVQSNRFSKLANWARVTSLNNIFGESQLYHCKLLLLDYRSVRVNTCETYT
jgi:hypothetical protein